MVDRVDDEISLVIICSVFTFYDIRNSMRQRKKGKKNKNGMRSL